MPKYYELYDMLSSIAQEVGLGKISPADAAKKGQAEMLKLRAACYKAVSAVLKTEPEAHRIVSGRRCSRRNA